MSRTFGVKTPELRRKREAAASWIGRKIRDRRKQLKLTQEQVAGEVFTAAYISAFGAGAGGTITGLASPPGGRAPGAARLLPDRTGVDQPMSEPVTQDDVLRKISLANEMLDDSGNTYSYAADERLLFATQALAQAQVATAYATLMVAEKQPLGVLGDLAIELHSIASSLDEARAR